MATCNNCNNEITIKLEGTLGTTQKITTSNCGCTSSTTPKCDSCDDCTLDCPQGTMSAKCVVYNGESIENTLIENGQTLEQILSLLAINFNPITFSSNVTGYNDANSVQGKDVMGNVITSGAFFIALSTGSPNDEVFTSSYIPVKTKIFSVVGTIENTYHIPMTLVLYETTGVVRVFWDVNETSLLTGNILISLESIKYNVNT